MELNINPKYIVVRNLKNTWKSEFTFEYKSKQLKSIKAQNKLEEKIDFQTNLLNALRLAKRRVFLNDVAVFIEILVNQKNAPLIHNISKLYIDLICKPIPEANIPRKYLILKDDLQIKYLNVIYTENNDDDSQIRFQVVSYHLFKERINLVKWFNFYNINSNDDFEDQYEKFKHDDSMFYYKEHLNDRNQNKSDFKYWEYWYQRRAQQTYLHNNRIKNKSIVNIFYPVTPSIDDLSKPLTGTKYKLNNEEIVYELNINTFQFNLGALPTEKGNGENYKTQINIQVDNYLSKREFLFPLLTPLGITVLVQQGMKQHKDLDNIAREIINVILKKLNPPTSLWNSLQDVELEKINRNIPMSIPSHIKNTISSQPEPNNPQYSEISNFPKNGYIKYKVIYLPPTTDQSKEYVRLNIHNADYFEEFHEYINRKFDKLKRNFGW